MDIYFFPPTWRAEIQNKWKMFSSRRHLNLNWKNYVYIWSIISVEILKIQNNILAYLNYDKIHSKLSIFCVITAKYTVNCQIFALNLKKFTPARKIYTDGVGRVGDNYPIHHWCMGLDHHLRLFSIVANHTW